MRIEDVKQWNCGNGLAVAVNPYVNTEQVGKATPAAIIDRLKYLRDFEEWASDPANQPVTDLSGIYNSEHVKEVWELKDIDSDFWILEAKLSPENSTYEYFDYYYCMLSNDIETRRRLVLEAALCNTDSSVKEGKQVNPRNAIRAKLIDKCNDYLDQSTYPHDRNSFIQGAFFAEHIIKEL